MRLWRLYVWLMRFAARKGALLIGGLAVALTACGRRVATAASAQSRVVQVARSYIGTPYRHGGTDRRGVDCSGLVFRTYQEALGLQLPRTADVQAQVGRSVPLSSVQAGDLVFFREPKCKKITHVGIVVGADGRFIHASTSKGVREDRLDDPYWRARVVAARRVLAAEAAEHTGPPAKKAASKRGTAKRSASEGS